MNGVRDGRIRNVIVLSGMMFLQYYGLGAWIVPLARYLAASVEAGGLAYAPSEVGLLYATLPLAGMISALAVGPLADRYFAAEKLLAVLQTGAGLALLITGWYAGVGATVDTLFPWLMVYALLYMPTLPLTTVIALKNLERPNETFSRVRLFGTLGWIGSGLTVAWFLNPLSPEPVYLAGFTALALGAFAFALPHTPPIGRGRPISEILGLSALQMFAKREFLIFAVAALLASMTNQFYVLFASRFFAESGISRPEQAMTLAQWCEIACMAAVPWFLRAWGLKIVMFVGLVGWSVRTATMAWAPIPWAVGIGVPLHGLGYVFFTIVAAMFVDRDAPPHLRSGAQALVAFLGSGPAVLVGNWMAGYVGNHYLRESDTHWSLVWAVPTALCALAAVIFGLFFRDPATPPPASVADLKG